VFTETVLVHLLRTLVVSLSSPLPCVAATLWLLFPGSLIDCAPLFETASNYVICGFISPHATMCSLTFCCNFPAFITGLSKFTWFCLFITKLAAYAVESVVHRPPSVSSPVRQETLCLYHLHVKVYPHMLWYAIQCCRLSFAIHEVHINSSKFSLVLFKCDIDRNANSVLLALFLI
jgi:hypothetical protein